MNNKIIAEAIHYFDAIFDENGKMTKVGEKRLLHHFPILSKLKDLNRNNNSRYDHTLLILEHFQYVVNNDYISFIRLDDRAKERGERVVNQKQFTYLNDLVIRLFPTEQTKEHFLLLLLLHDIGAIYGDDRHFVKSGQMTIEYFRSAGYSELNVALASIINGNHSYFGDLFLGEGTPVYGDQLLLDVEKMETDSDHFWDQLWLLNVLDIHASGGGYFSEQKYNELMLARTPSDLRKLGQNWHKDRFIYLAGDPDFSIRNREALKKDYGLLYFQYFNYIATRLSDEEFLKVLDFSLTLTELKDDGALNSFHFITFSSDSTEATKHLKHALQTDKDLVILSKTEGSLFGLPYHIGLDGYLTIELI